LERSLTVEYSRILALSLRRGCNVAQFLVRHTENEEEYAEITGWCYHEDESVEIKR
jgi:hypothetical protein